MLVTIFKTVEAGALSALRWTAFSPVYPLLVGGLAFAFTVSMLVPFGSILIGSILVCRERWLAIVFLSSLGSTLGGLLLYLIFHHWGWSQITAAYPDLTQSKAWADATRWVSDYGTWALLFFAASPLPQTPVLIATAISRLPVVEILLALFLGKLLKYGFYGWLAARTSPWAHRFVRLFGPR